MYYIKEITMTGAHVEKSTVVLKPGVNILYGPSNTGKSYVAECIDYLMGNNETRIDDSKGYDAIHLVIDVDGYYLSMDRKLNDTLIRVSSAVPGINSGDYRLQGDNKISSVWLKLMGINEPHRIITSAHCQKDDLSNRAFDQIFVIREKRIDSESSVLLPTEPSSQPKAKTALLFLMTGDDHDDGNTYDKPAVDKAKKSAVMEFADQQLRVIKEEQEELEGDMPTEIPSVIEERISVLMSEIDHTESEISHLVEQNNKIGATVYRLDKELAEGHVLQNRYKSLQSQYRSDLKRLTFMVEGEVNKENIPKPRSCPFCGQELGGSNNDSCIQAASVEAAKLAPKMADLKSVQKQLKEELQEKAEEREKLVVQMKGLDAQVQSELQPKIDQLRDQLAQYTVSLSKYNRRDTLEKLESMIRANLNEYKNRPEPPSFSINEQFQRAVGDQFQKILDELLIACKFDDYRESDFDIKKFDLVVNNTKKKSYGQGYRAFLNVILSMAVQIFLKEYGVYQPSIFVMDSPVLSLKEEVDDTELASESMKSALFTYIIQHPCAEQIIIIENDLPEADYSNVNLLHFTKDSGFWKTKP